MLFEAWDKDKYSRDDYIGGLRSSTHYQLWHLAFTHKSATRAGGFLMGQKYIDSPNEEFTETVTLYEKGVKNVKKRHVDSAAGRNVAAGDIEYQGQGTDTGIVSFHAKPRHACLGLVACCTLSPRYLSVQLTATVKWQPGEGETKTRMDSHGNEIPDGVFVITPLVRLCCLWSAIWLGA
eukprot:COSAG02_NODE_22130_length_762_cov_1.357466_1_plen_179_part_00